MTGTVFYNRCKSVVGHSSLHDEVTESPGQSSSQGAHVQSNSEHQVVTVPEITDCTSRTVEWIAQSPFPESLHVGSLDSGGVSKSQVKKCVDYTEQSVSPDYAPPPSADVSMTVAASSSERLTVRYDSDAYTHPHNDNQ